MAACDQGYICDVCGEDVEVVTESDLYLRYVLGEVSPAALPTMRERHIRCNPETAQYIVDDRFPLVACEGVFDKKNLNAEFIRKREALVTRAWQRLEEIPTLGIPITEYPLPEVLAKWETP